MKRSGARSGRTALSVSGVDLFRTKSVEKIGEDAGGEGDAQDVGRLRKHLSARHLVAFGIGVVIGTGIFTLTGVEARNAAGPAVVISFVNLGPVGPGREGGEGDREYWATTVPTDGSTMDKVLAST